ncbi:MAG TPA: hypothetical protein VFK02_13675 [Kofleriaceae bacterium]|nr:hypothetical protein [Kofleriaceae bacterium]
MGDFAIVAEGITDQIVLRNIILAYYHDRIPEPLIVFEQPPLDVTGRAGLFHAPGGWTLVVRYLRERKYRQALQLNQYVVIQMDSDIASELGITRPVGVADEPFVDMMINRLISFIPEQDLASVRDRLLFAIGLDEIECWLLPLVFDRSERTALSKTTGCLEAIHNKLRRSNERPLSTGDGGKDPRRYDRLSSQYRRRKQLEDAATNAGLARFVRQLGSCRLDPQGEQGEIGASPPGDPGTP